MEKKAAGGKRKSVVEMLKEDTPSQAAKKVKKAGYRLESEISKLIEGDTPNKKLWEECKNSLGDTKQASQNSITPTQRCLIKILF